MSHHSEHDASAPGVAHVMSVLSQLREYGSTFTAQGAVIVCQLLVFKLAAQLLGPDGFSEFAISRRTLSALQPITWMGLGVALPRYLANPSIAEQERARYYGATIVVISATTALCVAVLNLWARSAAVLFFGSADYTHLVFPISVLLAGMAVHAIAYSFFRGRLALRAANFLYFINLGVVPAVAILAFRQSAAAALLALGTLWLVVSGVAFLCTPWRAISSVTWASGTVMLRYGIPRVPGQFFVMALLAAPAILVAHSTGVREGGYVAFATSVVSMMGAGFMPISFVLLPKASQMIGSGGMRELRLHVWRLVTLTVVVCGLVTAVVVLFGFPLVRLYLGQDFADSGPIIRIAAFAITPYCLYIVLRGLIDAFHDKAVTTYNVVVACVGFAIVAAGLEWLGFGAGGTMAALATGLGVLGALSWWEAHRILASADLPRDTGKASAMRK